MSTLLRQQSHYNYWHAETPCLPLLELPGLPPQEAHARHPAQNARRQQSHFHLCGTSICTASDSLCNPCCASQPPTWRRACWASCAKCMRPTKLAPVPPASPPSSRRSPRAPPTTAAGPGRGRDPRTLLELAPAPLQERAGTRVIEQGPAQVPLQEKGGTRLTVRGPGPAVQLVGRGGTRASAQHLALLLVHLGMGSLARTGRHP